MSAIVRAGALYFGLVFGAGFVLGAIRVTFLVPRFGERIAELAEMPLMLVVIHFAARLITQCYSARIQGKGWIVVGAVALFLLLLCELGLAVVLQDRPLSAYIRSRDPVSGTVYLVMLALFALWPARQARNAATR